MTVSRHAAVQLNRRQVKNGLLIDTHIIAAVRPISAHLQRSNRGGEAQ
jgi:hypothetical protein